MFGRRAGFQEGVLQALRYTRFGRAKRGRSKWRNALLKSLSALLLTVTMVAGTLLWLVRDNSLGSGPMDYWRLALGSVAGLALILIVFVASLPPRLRRPVGMRIAAVTGALLLVVGIYEIGCYQIPLRSVENNPWYLATGEAMDETNPLLPYVRPPHINWTGKSHGNLAARRYEQDPYAEEVTFQTDHEGFRNSKDISQADVIFIGDSYTEAGNADEDKTFVQLVGAELGATVRNLGRAGYCPATELIVLQDQGLRCQPKVVVWQIAEANDMQDTRFYLAWVEALGRGFRLSYRQVVSGQASKLKAWMHRSLTYRLYRTVRRVDLFQDTDWAGTFRDAQGQLWPMRLRAPPNALLLPERTREFHALWRTVQQGHRLLQERGIALLVIVMPTKFRVLAPTLEFDEQIVAKLKQGPFPLSAPLWDVPPGVSIAARIQQFLSEAGVLCVDATAALRQSAQAGVMLYPPNDTHLSPQGHQVFSQIIVKHIKGLLDATGSAGAARR